VDFSVTGESKPFFKKNIHQSHLVRANPAFFQSSECEKVLIYRNAELGKRQIVVDVNTFLINCT
jgi:hypothetical protein